MLLPRSLDLTCQSSKSGNGKKRISNNCRMLLLSSVPIKVVKACGIRSFKFTIYERGMIIIATLEHIMVCAG